MSVSDIGNYNSCSTQYHQNLFCKKSTKTYLNYFHWKLQKISKIEIIKVLNLFTTMFLIISQQTTDLRLFQPSNDLEIATRFAKSAKYCKIKRIKSEKLYVGHIRTECINESYLIIMTKSYFCDFKKYLLGIDIQISSYDYKFECSGFRQQIFMLDKLCCEDFSWMR